MAADVTETEQFNLTPEQVFDYLVDFSNLSEWDPMFDRSSRIDGDGPVGVGATFEVVAEKAGVTMPITYTVEEYVRPRHAKLVGRGKGFVSIDTIDVAPYEAGTRMTWNARVETDVPLVDTLATPVFKAVAKASMHGLRRTLAPS